METGIIRILSTKCYVFVEFGIEELRAIIYD